MAWCGVVWCGVVWRGVVWCSVAWCSVVWRGMVIYLCGGRAQLVGGGDGGDMAVGFLIIIKKF